MEHDNVIKMRRGLYNVVNFDTMYEAIGYHDAIMQHAMANRSQLWREMRYGYGGKAIASKMPRIAVGGDQMVQTRFYLRLAYVLDEMGSSLMCRIQLYAAPDLIHTIPLEQGQIDTTSSHVLIPNHSKLYIGEQNFAGARKYFDDYVRRHLVYEDSETFAVDVPYSHRFAKHSLSQELQQEAFRTLAEPINSVFGFFLIPLSHINDGKNVSYFDVVFVDEGTR